jgi:hypothetical protein
MISDYIIDLNSYYDFECDTINSDGTSDSNDFKEYLVLFCIILDVGLIQL